MKNFWVTAAASVFLSGPAFAAGALDEDYLVHDFLTYAHEVSEISEEETVLIEESIRTGNAKNAGAVLFCAKAKGFIAIADLSAQICMGLDLQNGERKGFLIGAGSIGPKLNFSGTGVISPGFFIGASVGYVGGPDYRGLASIPGNYFGPELEFALKFGGGIAVASKNPKDGDITFIAGSIYFGTGMAAGATKIFIVGM